MNQFVRIVLIMLGLLWIGTLGFVVIEKWSVTDALFMAVITLTTVGYREVQELTGPGRIFTSIYLFVGLGIFFYELAQLGEIIVRGEVGKWMGRRWMDTRLKALRNHFIICGYGRLGSRLCQELASRKLSFVVIDKDPNVLQACESNRWPSIVGDATDDEVLLEAGIQQARGLAAVLSEEADNLYVVLSARLLSKDIRILSRASTEKGEEKLVKAGASQVVSLHATGATKMAQILANPNVDDFIEIISAQGKALDLAEVQVTAASGYAGKMLQESNLRRRGIIVVGIRRAGGELLLLPGGTDVPQVGDYLLALGKGDAISSLIAQG